MKNATEPGFADAGLLSERTMPRVVRGHQVANQTYVVWIDRADRLRIRGFRHADPLHTFLGDEGNMTESSFASLVGAKMSNI